VKTNIQFLLYLAQFFSEREMFQTEVAEKTKTHILCSKTFFSENRVVYGKTWKNIVQPDRRQMTIWRMRISCWVT